MSLSKRALKALAWVAPRAALARAQALGLVEDARAYDGAKTGRRGESFTDRNSSANVEIGAVLGRLRNRSRDLARNTPAGRRVLDIRTGHAIGTGIIAVPDNGSDRVDNAAKQEWDDWCPTADIEGILDFAGLQKSAHSAMLEGGDSVIRRVPRRLDGGQRVPLKLKVLEGDYIDAFRDRAVFEGHVSRLGVTLGDWDERTGYWLHPEHPGELTYRGTAYVSKWVPAGDVIHLFHPLRPGQVRGVPVFTPVLLNARDAADLFDAVLMKAKTEACLSLFVKTTGDQAASLGAVVKESGTARRLLERLAPGMIGYLNPGEDVVTVNPSSAGQFEPVYLAAQMAFAAGTGVTYDQLTGDLRQANYSSLRAGKIEGRRLTEQEQELILVPQMMRRVTGWFTDAAILSGALKPRKAGYRWKYIMPAVEPIDPLKDLQADILAVRSGRLSPQEFLGSWGQDWRKGLADTADFFRVLDALPGDLVLDIDPRRTSQLGVAQSPEGDGAAAAKPATAGAD
ncbi:phage portal protein [Methylobacterium frigidaeris]|uniref:Phage portal protein n=1 Tax=Methylobacterium frigidaeris TaxID=2038277 RepID=A0AA37M7G2_9HYPH|nr:phage portal protein [Methylobacterium frigidaeris]PIK69806.1 phage portal protein [Methylobacterium frigidaeris]GJD65167.1 hypothetical protein MPEAHAMD_5354 [Methylobacterium frigidaeris]